MREASPPHWHLAQPPRRSVRPICFALKQRCTPATVLREGLEAAFAINPRLRGYILDDQGHLRVNVVIFIDGRRVRDLRGLTDPLGPDSRVHVLQALSGG